MHATGTFEVRMDPQGQDDAGAGSTLGRMRLEKKFQGDLEGSSRGEMLTAMTAVEGSAGYVAVERFSGALGGRRGSFVLQHAGVMRGPSQQLTILVLPDSGVEQLSGITGRMAIRVSDGIHSYDLDYTLPDP